MASESQTTLSSDMQRAAAALDKSGEYQASKGELRLNVIGTYPGCQRIRFILTLFDPGDAYTKVAGISSNSYVTTTTGLVNGAVSLLSPELDKFQASCDILMKSLDAVAKIHPFVTGKDHPLSVDAVRDSRMVLVAVLAFKTAVTFELTRRQNDKRILALHITMVDLMSVVGL